LVYFTPVRTNVDPDREPASRMLEGEQLTGLAAAGRSLPGHRGNAHVSPATVFRWVTKGCRAADGTVVKLEAVRLGSRWLTSREALARFAAALSEPAPAAPAQRPPAARRRAADRAAEELDRLGI
jgi:hypothetical protein